MPPGVPRLPKSVFGSSSLFRQACQHQTDNGQTDHDLADLGLAFVVPLQSAVASEPAEGALHRPGRRQTTDSRPALVGARQRLRLGTPRRTRCEWRIPGRFAAPWMGASGVKTSLPTSCLTARAHIGTPNPIPPRLFQGVPASSIFLRLLAGSCTSLIKLPMAPGRSRTIRCARRIKLQRQVHHAANWNSNPRLTPATGADE
jgi:hypothetical protein